MTSLADALVIDSPPLLLPWRSSRSALVALGAEPAMRDVTFLGLVLDAELTFDASALLVGARFNPIESRTPGAADELPNWIARHGPAIRARRAALEDALGGPGLGGQTYALTSRLPCPPVLWRFGEVTLTHEVAFEVDRGWDEIGYLVDRITVAWSPAPPA